MGVAAADGRQRLVAASRGLYKSQLGVWATTWPVRVAAFSGGSRLLGSSPLPGALALTAAGNCIYCSCSRRLHLAKVSDRDVMQVIVINQKVRRGNE